jgi:hypothetical protein
VVFTCQFSAEGRCQEHRVLTSVLAIRNCNSEFDHKTLIRRSAAASVLSDVCEELHVKEVHIYLACLYMYIHIAFLSDIL